MLRIIQILILTIFLSTSMVANEDDLQEPKCGWNMLKEKLNDDRYEPIGSSKFDILMIDKNIKDNKIWTLNIMTINHKEEYAYVRQQMEFKGEKYRILAVATYDCDGKTLDTDNEGNWNIIFPGSTAEALYKVYLKYKTPQKKKNNKK